MVKVKATYGNGAPRILALYDNGIVVCRAEYFENGQKMGLASYTLDGKVDGQVTYFYKDGSIRVSGYFSNGIRDSIWRDYDEQGHLTNEQIFNRGNLKNKTESN